MKKPEPGIAEFGVSNFDVIPPALTPGGNATR
jgi:hypothetical protein